MDGPDGVFRAPPETVGWSGAFTPPCNVPAAPPTPTPWGAGRPPTGICGEPIPLVTGTVFCGVKEPVCAVASACLWAISAAARAASKLVILADELVTGGSVPRAGVGDWAGRLLMPMGWEYGGGSPAIMPTPPAERPPDALLPPNPAATLALVGAVDIAAVEGFESEDRDPGMVVGSAAVNEAEETPGPVCGWEEADVVPPNGALGDGP